MSAALLRICSRGGFTSLQRGISYDCYDATIVGGGIVGLATARELLLQSPQLKVLVIEKEKDLAQHQTGHNSGVVHSGLYYKPGSLKAKLCVEGQNLTYKFCDEVGVPYKKVGKLVVALNQDEIPNLEALYQRGVENGVKNLRLISEAEIKEIEPHCQGLKAIHVPDTGIVDWALVAKRFAEHFTKMGGTILTGFEVDQFLPASETPVNQSSNDKNSYPLLIKDKSGRAVGTRSAIVCAGLQSDLLAKKSKCKSELSIIPIRGEYLVLKEELRHLVRGNIYPVPDPTLPFLGVHFTPRMDGSVWMGPNALLAFKLEGYNRLDFNARDIVAMIGSRGFLKLFAKHWDYGVMEFLRALIIPPRVEQLNRYITTITDDDVQKGPAGVRAQAVDKDGNLVEDFVFELGSEGVYSRILNVRNAPSPGATSSLAIAKHVLARAREDLII